MCRPPTPAERSADTASAERPISELEREIRELAGNIAAATCRWLLLVAEFDAREGWAVDGVRSCAHWLSWACSIGMGTAREHVRVAGRLRELPRVREAFGRGELSYCKVRALTRIATRGTEAQLVELGRHSTGAQLEKVVQGYRRVERATVERARDAHEQRYLRWSFDDDGSLRIEGRVPADEGAVLLSALESFAEPPAQPSRDENVPAGTSAPATAPQRRADALISLARCGLAAGDGVVADGEPVELVVHVDADTLPAERIHERSELEEGPALSPETVRRLGCDAALVRIIERDGRPLTVSRRTRTIPPSLRRALRSRDHGCCFPGCTHTRFLHAHHIHHWARGGPTKLDNLVQLCSYHHRLVHEGGFTVERARTGAVRFRRPNGREIPARRRLSAGASRGRGIVEQNSTRGLTVTSETCTPLSRGAPLDYAMAIEGLFARHPPPTGSP
jgi:5-methylcytosine-specific restriction endonuclease McrA